MAATILTAIPLYVTPPTEPGMRPLVKILVARSAMIARAPALAATVCATIPAEPAGLAVCPSAKVQQVVTVTVIVQAG